MTFNKTVLINGIRVVTESTSKFNSTVISLWIENGSKNEPIEIRGISHFIEHLMFRGTTHRNSFQIASELEDVGGEINAFTDRETTCFYTIVLDSYIEKAINLLSDIFFNSLFTEEDINKEKKVVLDEIEMYKNSVSEESYESLIENIWKNNELGHRIAGSKETLKNINQKKIKQFIKENYTTDRLIISIVGNINHDEIIKIVEPNFNQSKSLSKRAINGISHEKTKLFRYSESNIIDLCLVTKGTSFTSKDKYINILIQSILIGGMGSNLFQEIRRKRGLAYSLESFEYLYRKIGLFGIHIVANKENLFEIIEITLNEFEKMSLGEINNKQINRAKNYLKGSLMISLDSPKNRMIKIARDEIYSNRFISTNEIINIIDKISFNEIQQTANKIFSKKNLSISLIGNLEKPNIYLDLID